MPRVAIDISQIDRHTLNAGQFRYAIDLVREMAREPEEFEFVILGSRAEPPDELRGLDQPDGPASYRWLAPSTGRASFYRDLWRYSRWLRRARVDLFHQLVHYLPVPKPCPYVVTHYDCIAQRVGDRGLLDSRPYRYYGWAMRHLADAVISISDASARDAVSWLRVPAQRIITVPLGLSPHFAASGAPQPAEPPFLLAPFNLEPYKNLLGLVRALPPVLAAHPSLTVRLYGNARNFGDREAHFDAECHALGVHRAIERVGFVGDAELRRLYSAATLFVFPTLIEGFGLPLLEAMAAGACCVTTGESAMLEVGGDAVAYADTRNPAALARVLLSLLADPGRRADLARVAQARARTFTVEQTARRTRAVYRDVLRRT